MHTRTHYMLFTQPQLSESEAALMAAVGLVKAEAGIDSILSEAAGL